MPTAQEIIQKLNLTPHPEGGHYIQTFSDPGQTNGRPHSTCIFYLLERGQRSHWHRVDAVETWHYYAGAPLRLSLSNDDGEPVRDLVLGANLFDGQTPQGVVRKFEWQSARSLGEWTLVGCTVAPAFRFEGFEMAAPGWEPRGAESP